MSVPLRGVRFLPTTLIVAIACVSSHSVSAQPCDDAHVWKSLERSLAPSPIPAGPDLDLLKSIATDISSGGSRYCLEIRERALEVVREKRLMEFAPTLEVAATRACKIDVTGEIGWHEVFAVGDSLDALSYLLPERASAIATRYLGAGDYRSLVSLRVLRRLRSPDVTDAVIRLLDHGNDLEVEGCLDYLSDASRLEYPGLIVGKVKWRFPECFVAKSSPSCSVLRKTLEDFEAARVARPSNSGVH